MKICKKCKLEKNFDKFHLDNTKKDGLASWCKSCRSKKNIRKIIVKNSHKNLDKCINRSIYRSFKKQRENYIWERVINISFNELKKHLENSFDDIMSWDNYGSYWVIDKIIPTSMFKYSDIVNNEFKKAWCLKNLRPYPKHLHNKRKEKIIWQLVEYYKLYDILPIGLLGENLWKNKK